MELQSIADDLFEEQLQQEGITKEDLELVMLEIDFSPVIQFPGSRPVEVKETVGGNYIVLGDMPQTVSPQMLKLMRYRFLTSKYRGHELLNSESTKQQTKESEACES